LLVLASLSSIPQSQQIIGASDRLKDTAERWDGKKSILGTENANATAILEGVPGPAS
jgi:hypothetical protein